MESKVEPPYLLETEQLHLRARSLVAEFKQGAGANCIDEAISLDHEVLKLCPPDHALRCTSLQLLAYHLSIRYSRFGKISDLEVAIVLDREALVLCPQGHPDRSESLKNLANRLFTWYLRFGEISDLEEAIALEREALNFRTRGHPDRSKSLNNLANRLSTRYSRFGDISDLEGAIALHREALDLRPRGHPDRSTCLNNLAVDLSIRYSRFEQMSDLEEAIVLHREVLDLRPQGHPDRSKSLNNFAVDLSTRYLQLGQISDLEGAIVLDHEALHLHPQGHPNRSKSLNSLANHLSIRYLYFKEISDLEGAIVLHREALDLCPQGHPDRSKSLNNLAVDLFTRYSQSKEISDLEGTIVLHREALDLCPQGHPDRSMSLSTLANRLSTRYLQVWEIPDLEEAIVLHQEALDLRPQGHPHRSTSLEYLAFCLSVRYSALMQSDDKKDIFSLYAQLQNVPHVVSSNDLNAARAWVRAAEVFQHPTLNLAHKTCLQFLVQQSAMLPSLPQHLALLKDLTSSLAVDAFATCLCDGSSTDAVELLEQGRGVFWAQRTSLSSPLDEVSAVGPEGKTLATEFTRLASLLRDTADASDSDQYERSCRLHFELQRVVTKIRELPGLSRFLLPSFFSDLRRAASSGPVIIVNSSKHSCDALIISLDRNLVHVPLQITQEDVRDLSSELHNLTLRARRGDVRKQLAIFLRTLWDEVISPIVDRLQEAHPFRTRIWWCPTREFSLLPLHAAGPYRTGQRNLSELYISSYTPTLSALIRARRPRVSLSEVTTEEKRFVAVGQANAVGETELLSVSTELDIIRERIVGRASFTRIDGEKSCIPRVVEELGRNEWVHLACHGIPDQERPFKSAFAFHDGRLTIERMLGCQSKDAEFAYLSACHTTVGDKEGPDEAIHLASTMQFIGFRSVIGTMWAVDDGQTNKVVSKFYEHMVDDSGRLDHTRAALALNRTMRTVDIPFDQKILYVHIGA